MANINLIQKSVIFRWVWGIVQEWHYLELCCLTLFQFYYLITILIISTMVRYLFILSLFIYNTGEGDYNTDISGLYNTYILTAITPETWKFETDGMTAITPDTLKFWISEILSAWFRPSGVKAVSSSNFGKNYGHLVIFFPKFWYKDVFFNRCGLSREKRFERREWFLWISLDDRLFSVTYDQA